MPSNKVPKVLFVLIFFAPIVVYISCLVGKKMAFNNNCVNILYYARADVNKDDYDSAIKKLKQVKRYLEVRNMTNGSTQPQFPNTNNVGIWYQKISEGINQFEKSNEIEKVQLVGWIQEIIDQIPAGLAQFPHNNKSAIIGAFAFLLHMIGLVLLRLNRVIDLYSLILLSVAGGFILFSVTIST